MGTAVRRRLERDSEVQECPDFYIWSFPGMPLRIHLSLRTVTELRHALVEGLTDGIEIAGLLLGKAQSFRIEITGFVPFQPDNSSRQFILEDGDKAKLRNTIQALNKDGNHSVVGYFRSVLKGNVCLSADDLQLINECFRDPSQVFLVIAQDKEKSPTAGFFFWDNGTIFADSSFMTFPFDERLLALESAALAATHANQALSQAELQVPQNAESMKSRRGLGLLTVLLAGLAILGAVAVLYLRPFEKTASSPAAVPTPVEPPSITQPAPTMSLSGLRIGPNVEITWNPQSAVFASARVGVLTIKDGDVRRELFLTPAQLQARKLIFTPRTDNVEVTLEIFSSDRQSTRETMLFLLSQPAIASRERAQTASSDNAAEKTPDAEVIVSTTAPLSSSISTATSTATPRLAFTPPEVRPSNATPNLIQPPSSLAPLSSATHVQAPTAISGVPQAPTPPPAVRETSQVATPTASEPISQPSKQAPLPSQPPKAIHQVRPVLPANVSALVSRRAEIDVRVDVDPNGNIVRTQPLVSSGTLNAYLGNAAAAAAQLWKFEPAKQGSQSIAGSIVLKFVFEPGRR